MFAIQKEQEAAIQKEQEAAAKKGVRLVLCTTLVDGPPAYMTIEMVKPETKMPLIGLHKNTAPDTWACQRKELQPLSIALIKKQVQEWREQDATITKAVYEACDGVTIGFDTTIFCFLVDVQEADGAHMIMGVAIVSFPFPFVASIDSFMVCPIVRNYNFGSRHLSFLHMLLKTQFSQRATILASTSQAKGFWLKKGYRVALECKLEDVVPDIHSHLTPDYSKCLDEAFNLVRLLPNFMFKCL